MFRHRGFVFRSFLSDFWGSFWNVSNSGSKHVQLVNTISTSNLCQKIGLLLQLLLLYFKLFSPILSLLLRLSCFTKLPREQKCRPFLASTGYKVGTPADVLFSFLLRLFDIVVFPLMLDVNERTFGHPKLCSSYLIFLL